MNGPDTLEPFDPARADGAQRTLVAALYAEAIKAWSQRGYDVVIPALPYFGDKEIEERPRT